MLKFLNFALLISLCGAAVIQVPTYLENNEIDEILPLESQIDQELWNKWFHHVMDFLNLLDMETVMNAVMGHLTDPDVINFMEFLNSKDLKTILVDFQKIEEFKEGVDYLQSKGYKAQAVLDIINTEIMENLVNPSLNAERFGSGVTDLIEDVVKTLPMGKIKELLVSKIKTDEDVARLFETITAPEFVNIAKKLVANPKFISIQKVLEGYGFDFERLRKIAENAVSDE